MRPCTLVYTQGDRASPGLPALPLLLSPRGAEKAAALAAEFGPGAVRVCADNQSLLDACGVVLLGLKVPACADVVGGLAWRPEHRVINFVASGDVSAMTGGVVPPASVVQVVPLPPIARGHGVPIVHPPEPAVLAFCPPPPPAARGAAGRPHCSPL
jgi:pyrroline-5-carboxylate reductase